MGENGAPFASLIEGLGPKSEAQLHARGVHTMQQLAALSVPELAAKLAGVRGMSAQKIESKDILGQAREKAQAGSGSQEKPAKDAGNNRQHYASFTLELLLNKDNSVRGTTVTNNKNKKPGRWTGWDGEKLTAFIAEQSGVKFAPPKIKAEPANPPETQTTVPEPAKSAPPAAGTVKLRQLDARLSGTEQPCHAVPHNQPFEMWLTLDLVDFKLPENSQLDYTAAIYAKQLGTGQRRLVGEKRSSAPLQRRLSIPVKGVQMPAGDFRLEAEVALRLPHTGKDFKSRIEGSVLQVY